MKLTIKKTGETFIILSSGFSNSMKTESYRNHLTSQGDFNRFRPGTSNWSDIKTFNSIEGSVKWMSKNMPEKEFFVQKAVIGKPYETVYKHLNVF